MPQAEIETRPRLSQLTFAGPEKLVRLPPRSAVVAFSAGEVYAIAELIRRRRGGCAVVMGRLSPRTRNAQVALYQEKEVDFLVATDAIGMGLNMDVDHVAFARLGKFDGHRPRRLSAAEVAQIAGRAGRGMRDGTFGTTAGCAPDRPGAGGCGGEPPLRAAGAARLAQQRPGLHPCGPPARQPDRPAATPRPDPRAGRVGPGDARRSGPGGRHPGDGDQPADGAHAVGSLPDPGFPQAGR
ncbi:MAG: helicase-related protein [Acetobacteraceae bacterium]